MLIGDLLALPWLLVQKLFSSRVSPCSFCGKQKDEVNILVAGPGVFICDYCVIEFKQLLANPEPSSRVERTARKSGCSFCSFMKGRGLFSTSTMEKETQLILGREASICDECLDICTEVIAEQKTDS